MFMRSKVVYQGQMSSVVNLLICIIHKQRRQATLVVRGFVIELYNWGQLKRADLSSGTSKILTFLAWLVLMNMQLMLNIVYVIFLCGSLFPTGARRFAVLDFGRLILMTDIYIPSCLDLASLSVDVWNQGEEQDGRWLAVALTLAPKILSWMIYFPLQFVAISR